VSARTVGIFSLRSFMVLCSSSCNSISQLFSARTIKIQFADLLLILNDSLYLLNSDLWIVMFEIGVRSCITFIFPPRLPIQSISHPNCGNPIVKFCTVLPNPVPLQVKERLAKFLSIKHSIVLNLCPRCLIQESNKGCIQV
jgi:hypothetical protein